MNKITCLQIVFLCFITGYTIAQDLIYKVNGNPQHIKKELSKSQYNKRCILCEDKLLKKNCKTYLCTNTGECIELPLNESQFQYLMAKKSIGKLAGIKSTKEINLNYLQDQSNVYYLYSKTESTIGVATVAINDHNQIISRRKSPEEKTQSCIESTCPKFPVCCSNGDKTSCCADFFVEHIKCSRNCKRKYQAKSLKSSGIDPSVISFKLND